MSTVITVEGIGKRYDLGATHQRNQRLSEVIYDLARKPLQRRARRGRDIHWALKDINLEIGEGEVVGFVGHNGAGKSTLLKILARITEPTTGQATLVGRVGALLEVGTGFHGELSGRENIYLSGAILGMTRKDIDRRFDEIVAFSEIEKFLDTPVKRYSSGMYVRLAFAVAAHLEPEILLIDEVLAVGDAAFQRKCLGKMENVADEGRTVVFVSHNMATIQSLCSRAYLLNQGELVQEGTPREVVQSYQHMVNSTIGVSLEDREDRRGDGSARVTALSVVPADGTSSIRVGTPLEVRLRYRSERPLKAARFLVSLYDITRTGIHMLDSDVHGGVGRELPTEGELVCRTAPLMVTPGRCYLNVSIMNAGLITDFVDNAGAIEVEDDDPLRLGRLPPRDWAVSLIDQSWEVVEPGSGPQPSYAGLTPVDEAAL